METVLNSLQRLEAHHPSFSPKEPNGGAVCSKECQFRMGAWLPHVGTWMHVQWEAEFFKKFNPSIDFLELYSLLARVVTWVPHLTNCTLLFHSDNTPTMHALINKSSDSHQMMILLQFLTLFCMLNNITITVKHISGKTNLICDYLSQLKF